MTQLIYFLKLQSAFWFRTVRVSECCLIKLLPYIVGLLKNIFTFSQGRSGAGTRWNAVPANILEPERRSGKYTVSLATGGTRTAFRQITSYSLGWPSISLFSGPNCPQTRDLASKISKKIPGVISGPLSRTGRPHSAPTPARLHAVRGGASSSVAVT